MSAADKREELEAAVRLAIKGATECRHTGLCQLCDANARAAMAAADDFAYARAVDRVNRLSVADLSARLRLAEAAAEATATS